MEPSPDETAPDSAVPDAASSASRRVHIHVNPLTEASGSTSDAVSAVPTSGSPEPKDTSPPSSTSITVTVTAMVSSTNASTPPSTALPSDTDTVSVYDGAVSWSSAAATVIWPVAVFTANDAAPAPLSAYTNTSPASESDAATGAPTGAPTAASSATSRPAAAPSSKDGGPTAASTSSSDTGPTAASTSSADTATADLPAPWTSL